MYIRYIYSLFFTHFQFLTVTVQTDKERMDNRQVKIEYEPYNNVDKESPEVFKLTVRCIENMYSLLVAEQAFSSLYLELRDLGKVFRDEDLGIPGLTSCVKYTEDFHNKQVVIELELTYQRAAKTKRATENFVLRASKVERDEQLERICKLEAETELLQREKERLSKQIRTLKYYGFEPYFHKDIQPINTIYRVHAQTDRGHYQSPGTQISGGVTLSTCRYYKNKHYLAYDSAKHATLYNFLLFHPRFKQYATWVRQEHTANNTGNPAIIPCRLHFQDPMDTVEYLDASNSFPFTISFSQVDINFMRNLFEENPGIPAERNRINKRQNEFFCTLFDVLNEYHFRGVLLLPGGRCMPHPTNPEHINEFFTERYCKELPTPEAKMFFDPCVGFYRCDLYDF